jgi:hypothetical protein
MANALRRVAQDFAEKIIPELLGLVEPLASGRNLARLAFSKYWK